MARRHVGKVNLSVVRSPTKHPIMFVGVNILHDPSKQQRLQGGLSYDLESCRCCVVLVTVVLNEDHAKTSLRYP